ncbi:pyridoxal phosphate-dependent transferase [Aspergillus pseudoustus]|uniref:Pyridoxal phosphate-dependent transferase n=1 Tax=Aspergillus pseudoustus TaxID=1810923 RepID=A0ABR4K1W8_9EURO
MSSLLKTASDYLHIAEGRYEARNPKSKLQHEAAARYLPGGNTRSVLHASPFPLCMASGKGNRVIDLDGHEYLDLVGEMTAGVYGHSNAVIAETIAATVNKIGMSLGATTVAEAQFAKAVCDRFASIEQLRFCNSGTEANLYALSIARQATGRSKIIVFEGAYHGGVLTFGHGVASNTVDRNDWIIGQYNDVEGTKRLITENKGIAAAVLLEGMQGAGGCIPATAEFLHAIQDTAQENGVIFILDEVATSRLAPGGLQSVVFHPERGAPLSPDLTTLGKWIAGGLTIGAFGGRQDLLSVYDPRRSNISHSGTFNNNILAMTVGYQSMRLVYTPEACIALNQLGEKLRRGLNELAKGTKMAVTGHGSVMAVHFLAAGGEKNVKSVRDLQVESGSEEGVLRDLFWVYVIERGVWIARRGMLSLILGTSDEDIDRFLGVVRAFLDQFRDLVSV